MEATGFEQSNALTAGVDQVAGAKSQSVAAFCCDVIIRHRWVGARGGVTLVKSEQGWALIAKEGKALGYVTVG
jgi:hypothetical protein